MKVHSSFETLYTSSEISEQVSRVAFEITRDYEDRCPLLIGVLKGSFVFMADLIRLLNIPLEVDFVKVESYGSSTISSGVVNFIQGLSSSIEGKEVIVVEDIVDTGLTVNHLLSSIRDMGAASIRLCVMFEKQLKRGFLVPIDYLGMTVPDKFVVGYGLDYKGQYRGLSNLQILELH